MKIFLAGRGAGKTYQLVQLVKADHTGVYIAPTWERAFDVAREYGLTEKQVHSIRSVDSLRGLTPARTLYVDQFDVLKDADKVRGWAVEAIVIEGHNAWTPMHGVGSVRNSQRSAEELEDLAIRVNTTVDLHNRFTYHRPIEGQPAKYEKIRAKGLSLAGLIEKLCPPSKERTEAINKIDEAVMWANASIARNS